MSNSLGVLPGDPQSLCQIPRMGNLLLGPRTFLTVWEFIWYNCSAVCESSVRQLYGGANGDLLQEGLYHMLHDPGLLQPASLSPWQATTDPCPHRKHSNTQRQSGSVSVGSLGPGTHIVLFEPSKNLWWVWGFDSKSDFTPSTVLLGLLLCPWTWGIFFWWDPYSPIDGCLAVCCNFAVFARENEHTSFYSTILLWHCSVMLLITP